MAREQHSLAMNWRYRVLTSLLPLMLSACVPSWWGYDPVPTFLVDPSDADRAELSRVVGEALHRPPVLLAPDALTGQSTLIVEPVMPRDAGGLPLNGRELGRPERFQLVRDGSSCLLVHERTGKRWKLLQRCQ
jgi:hypothetical protein